MANRERLLEMALRGLEAERAKLDIEITEIKRALGQPSTGATVGARQKMRMSPEARKKISEGMKRRYAQLRKAMKK